MSPQPSAMDGSAVTTSQVMGQMVGILMCALAVAFILQGITRRLWRRSLPVIPHRRGLGCRLVPVGINV